MSELTRDELSGLPKELVKELSPLAQELSESKSPVAQSETFSSVCVGARIESVRNSAGISQEEMARALDVSLWSYRRYVAHRRPIPLHIAKSVIVRFDVDPKWLLFGDEGLPTPSKKGGE